MKQQNILITSGEPAGIGPDLIINLADDINKLKINQHIRLIVLADPDLLKARANELNKTIQLNCINKQDFDKNLESNSIENNVINVLPIYLKEKAISGKLNVNNASYVMEMLDTAIALCLSNTCQAIVTCPIQKSILLDAGFKLQGHTEYLAEKCDTEKVVMMLANSHLRVALMTTHIPLNTVSAAINQDDIINTINIIHKDLQKKFSIQNPAIYVCGLNPHAGENGHLGKEEQTIIIPAINKLKELGINIIGPLPADTIFNKQNREKADVFVAMYHDQGLPVLKALGFGDSINITLGLPIIRTSVDHGTALDLAGKGQVNNSSLIHALNTAIELCI
jgi:4-hydroxythreonine-4-phosphate dehydrogenase